MSRMLAALKRLAEHDPNAAPATTAGPSMTARGSGAAPIAQHSAPVLPELANSTTDVQEEVACQLDLVQRLAEQLHASPPALPGREHAPSLVEKPRPVAAVQAPMLPPSQPVSESAAPAATVHRASTFSSLGERRQRDRVPAAPPHIALLRDNVLSQLTRNRPNALLFLRPGTISDATTTVAELAVALADVTRHEVLAVDADLAADRSGANHADSEQESKDLGLVDVLAGKAPWQDAVAATRNPHVLLLPAGRRAIGKPFDPAADPAQLHALLDEMKETFSLLLIDGGDASSALSRALAPRCEAAYLFTELGVTPRRELFRALATIQAAQGRVLGLVAVGDA